MLEVDTFVNIIIAIAVVVILYLAQQNEKRNSGTKQVTADVKVDKPVANAQRSEPEESGKGNTAREEPVKAERECAAPAVTHEIGSSVEVLVRDIHFTKHKCKIKGESPTMAQMMKWTKEQFANHEFPCAFLSFGSFSCWAAEGNMANRMLYVMKKREIDTTRVTVVPSADYDGDDYPDTCGTDYGKIQLIP